MKTDSEYEAEQKRLHPFIKPDAPKQMLSLITPGRRAYGEQWTKVVLSTTPEGLTMRREDAPAPADGSAIVACAGADTEYANYIIEAQFEKAKARAVQPHELSYEEKYAAVNEAWMAYMEQKIRRLKRQSSIGPGGTFQRD